MICLEMQKFRNWLDANNVKWIDKSDNMEYGLNTKDYICRTHIYIDDNLISVINGMGTYGGYGILDSNNQGKLEVMAWFIDGGEPRGWQTADEVIELIKGVVLNE